MITSFLCVCYPSINKGHQSHTTPRCPSEPLQPCSWARRYLGRVRYMSPQPAWAVLDYYRAFLSRLTVRSNV